jgi:predicted nuclease with TOPRIM domain
MTPEQILRQCNRLRREIEEAKQVRSEKMGERQALLRQLKERFGCDSLEDARKRISNLDVQITRRNKKIDQLYRELQRKYDL